MNIKTLFRILLFLLAVNLLAENFGYLTHQLYQLLGMVVLAVYGLAVLPRSTQNVRRVQVVWGCALIAAAVFFFSGAIPMRLAGVVLVLYGLVQVIQGRGGKTQEIPISTQTTFPR